MTSETTALTNSRKVFHETHLLDYKQTTSCNDKQVVGMHYCGYDCALQIQNILNRKLPHTMCLRPHFLCLQLLCYYCVDCWCAESFLYGCFQWSHTAHMCNVPLCAPRGCVCCRPYLQRVTEQNISVYMSNKIQNDDFTH